MRAVAVPDVVLRKFRELYDPATYKVWVYSDGQGSLQYQAKLHGDQPNQVHPIRTNHRLVGWVELDETGTPDTPTRGNEAIEIGWVPLLWALGKAILLFLVTSLTLFLSILGLGRPRTRTRI